MSIDSDGDDRLLAIITADSCMDLGITGCAPASSKSFTISLHASYLTANSKLVCRACKTVYVSCLLKFDNIKFEIR